MLARSRSPRERLGCRGHPATEREAEQAAAPEEATARRGRWRAPDLIVRPGRDDEFAAVTLQGPHR
ncbi:hypothetical protein [Streptomyces noursei]|uniref:hypothetical protein n=1 Tax=Streptomyces noursei TaxID=1971 RepID=UPI0011AEDEA9|nr:hypothetical protein [Streptomyces noursei]